MCVSDALIPLLSFRFLKQISYRYTSHGYIDHFITRVFWTIRFLEGQWAKGFHFVHGLECLHPKFFSAYGRRGPKRHDPKEGKAILVGRVRERRRRRENERSVSVPIGRRGNSPVDGVTGHRPHAGARRGSRLRLPVASPKAPGIDPLPPYSFTHLGFVFLRAFLYLRCDIRLHNS